jgi:hypothetical protein
VTGYTADYLINGVPDTTGPGTLTLGTAATASTRGAVISADASQVYYAQQPSALTIDALTTTSTLTLASIRQAIAGLRTQNVPKHPDGRYHAHLSPVAEEEIFGDPETQRMLTALPDYYMYREFAVGELQGAIFYENTEAPTLGTVVNSSAAYQPQDYFGGELENSASTQMQYTLFTGQDGFFEFWVDQALFLTEAGIAGRVGDFRIVNNGIDVYVDHAKIILRESLNRTQDQVSATSWLVTRAATSASPRSSQVSVTADVFSEGLWVRSEPLLVLSRGYIRGIIAACSTLKGTSGAPVVARPSLPRGTSTEFAVPRETAFLATVLPA